MRPPTAIFALPGLKLDAAAPEEPQVRSASNSNDCPTLKLIDVVPASTSQYTSRILKLADRFT